MLGVVLLALDQAGTQGNQDFILLASGFSFKLFPLRPDQHLFDRSDAILDVRCLQAVSKIASSGTTQNSTSGWMMPYPTQAIVWDAILDVGSAWNGWDAAKAALGYYCPACSGSG
ncbi:hypothetical protein [Pseudomonas sp. NPDC096925]|uniref:hypothetical protein n=1 Tax=Pseudomonas sp. NPDC096925 TaxID=3364484 RepID=UPI00383B54C8